AASKKRVQNHNPLIRPRIEMKQHLPPAIEPVDRESGVQGITRRGSRCHDPGAFAAEPEPRRGNDAVWVASYPDLGHVGERVEALPAGDRRPSAIPALERVLEVPELAVGIWDLVAERLEPERVRSLHVRRLPARQMIEEASADDAKALVERRQVLAHRQPARP